MLVPYDIYTYKSGSLTFYEVDVAIKGQSVLPHGTNTSLVDTPGRQ